MTSGRMATLALLALLAPAAWAAVPVIRLASGSPPVTLEAPHLPAGQANAHALSIFGDKDGLLSIELQPHTRFMHPHMRLADGDGGTLMEAFADEDGKVTRLEAAVAPGDYLLEVDDSHRWERQDPYRLTASFIAIGDAYEPNDTLEAAKPLPLGQPVELTLFKATARDEDCFTIRHPGGRLAIQVSALAGVTPVVRLVNADRETVDVGQALNEGAALHHVATLRAGHYVLVVSDGSAGNRPGTMTLLATPL